MGKFCTKCGRPLEEGEICNCTGQTQQTQGAFGQDPAQGFAGQGAPQQGLQMTAATQYAKSFAQNLVGLLKTPVTTGRELCQVADIKVSMIYIVLQGFVSGLLGALLTTQLFSWIRSGVESAGGLLKSLGLSGDLSGATGMAENMLFKVPVARIILVTLLASAALNLILAGLLLLGHKILGQQTTYQRMLSAVSVRSALTIPTTLLALVFTLISKGFGVIFFFVAAIWGFVALIMVVDAGIEEQKKDLWALVMAVILLIFLVLLYFVITKLASNYLPDVLRGILLNMDFKSLWPEVLDELY